MLLQHEQVVIAAREVDLAIPFFQFLKVKKNCSTCVWLKDKPSSATPRSSVEAKVSCESVADIGE